MRMRAKYVSVLHASARNVAERWASQYMRDGVWRDTALGDSQDKYERLIALGDTPDIAKVAEIIGNKSWSYLSCSGCHEDVETAVRIGGEYNDHEQQFCITCIAEAHAILHDKEHYGDDCGAKGQSSHQRLSTGDVSQDN